MRTRRLAAGRAPRSAGGHAASGVPKPWPRRGSVPHPPLATRPGHTIALARERQQRVRHPHQSAWRPSATGAGTMRHPCARAGTVRDPCARAGTVRHPGESRGPCIRRPLDSRSPDIGGAPVGWPTATTGVQVSAFQVVAEGAERDVGSCSGRGLARAGAHQYSSGPFSEGRRCSRLLKKLRGRDAHSKVAVSGRRGGVHVCLGPGSCRGDVGRMRAATASNCPTPATVGEGPGGGGSRRTTAIGSRRRAGVRVSRASRSSSN